MQSTELPLEITLQCQQWREGRIGQDLVEDDVDAELAQERTLLQSVRQGLQQSERDCDGQLRLLRAAKYQIEADIRDKETAEGIDMSCATLNTTHRDITRSNNRGYDVHEGKEPHEWDAFTLDNIARATHERESADFLFLVCCAKFSLEEDIARHVGTGSLYCVAMSCFGSRVQFQ